MIIHLELNGGWLLAILGGVSMISGWIVYHFFDVIFDEAIKFVVLGIALILFSLIAGDLTFQEAKENNA